MERKTFIMDSGDQIEIKHLDLIFTLRCKCGMIFKAYQVPSSGVSFNCPYCKLKISIKEKIDGTS